MLATAICHRRAAGAAPRTPDLARTNYSFEKRQRELAKKRKKEDKAAKKAAGGADEEMTPNEAAMALAQDGGQPEVDGEPDDGKADAAGAAEPPRA